LSTNPLTTEIYTLSLHDALPISMSWWKNSPATTSSSRDFTSGKWIRCCASPEISSSSRNKGAAGAAPPYRLVIRGLFLLVLGIRSEEHTSELQSRGHLVCRLLLE